ncbi:hypothetical protein PR202_ga26295 [Eleusine coracana subsp. coracana]|uniref:Uncharacterized protein n=1 Tax=Eleusine coracana subsp. coracana TaxID=191504 RepID=A0AAV5DBK0_ELECO|nr:hypothetical protein PR202_ga26295 [Eleusine coracana subsp. coracana]
MGWGGVVSRGTHLPGKGELEKSPPLGQGLDGRPDGADEFWQMRAGFLRAVRAGEKDATLGGSEGNLWIWRSGEEFVHDVD